MLNILATKTHLFCSTDLSLSLKKKETFINNDQGFEKFCDMSIKLLDKHVLIKWKYKRGNQMPFATKDFSKVIMKRFKLRNNYLKKN